MKRSRFSEEQIISILKEQESGISVADLCRKHGVSDASIYKWKAKFGGMDVSEARRLRLDLRPAPGPGAALCDKHSARARRFTSPNGLQNRRNRTQRWIKTGGNVTDSLGCTEYSLSCQHQPQPSGSNEVCFNHAQSC